MTTIYLDHNIVSHIGGIPAAPTAESQRKHAWALRQSGYRFALSAWNMYELARSTDIKHIEQCCVFVDELDPVWVSNNQSVERQEVARFLQNVFDRIGPVRSKTVTPFNPTVAQMWATYGGPVLIGETFQDSVLKLRSDPHNIERIERAANLTPEAITTGRRAAQNGALKYFKFVIDREHFATLAPRGTPPEQIDYLAKHITDVLVASPAISVEETLGHIRLNDSFTPESGDASDLQHALVPLAYCDYFVTDDKQLREHCRIVIQKLKLKCQAVKSLEEVPVHSGTPGDRHAAVEAMRSFPKVEGVPDKTIDDWIAEGRGRLSHTKVGSNED